MAFRSVALALAGFIVGCAASSAAQAAEWTIFLGPEAGSQERMAAEELRLHLYGAANVLCEIETTDRLPARSRGFVLGTPESLPATTETYPFGLTPPKADGYIMRTLARSGPTLVLSAPEPRGVRNAVYGLLEDLGVGFYLSRTTYPEEAADIAAAMRGRRESVSPAFAVRGAVPRPLYFSGPAAWSLDDYEAYLDQLARMRMNLVVFPSCDYDPFSAWLNESEWEDGRPLPGTSEPAWGSQPLPSERFVADTEAYFAQPWFGAPSSGIVDRAEAILQARSKLRQAMSHARARGLTTGLAFTVKGDPFDPQVQEAFEQRVLAQLEAYPDVASLWLWAPEDAALSPKDSPEPRSQWDSYLHRWRAAFHGVEDDRRAGEGVRMALFALHAQRLLEAHRPGMRLVVGGWGGDQWHRFTDLLPGLAQILPDNVALSAFDDMRIEGNVSDGYDRIASERDAWPILWWEFDGDLWMPQPTLSTTARACRDADAKGCSGILGAHWRTEAVEESAAFTAQYAWDPDLGESRFLARRALHLYGEELASTMAEFHSDLQDLGYRWVDGGGLGAGARFHWAVGRQARAERLNRLAIDLAGLLKEEGLLDYVVRPLEFMGGMLPSRVSALKPDFSWSFPWQDRPDAERGAVKRQNALDLLGRIHFVLAYNHAARRLEREGTLDALLDQGQSLRAAEVIRNSGFFQAATLHAQRIRTKGDLGVLAELNTKAWANLRGRLNEAGYAVNELEDEQDADDSGVHLLNDRVIAPAARSGSDVFLRWRPLGARRYFSEEMEPLGDSSTVFKLEWPVEAEREGAVEYGVVLRGGSEGDAAWPPGFPRSGLLKTFLQAPSAGVGSAADRLMPSPVEPAIRVIPRRYAVRLEWTPRTGELYTVSRDGEVLSTVADGWFEDARPPANSEVRYAVQTRIAGTDRTAIRDEPASIPELPLPQPPQRLTVGTRAGRAILGWESDAANAVAYLVNRYDRYGGQPEMITVEADHGRHLQFGDLTTTPGRAYTYSVAAVAPDGRVGPASARAGVIPTNAPLVPKLSLSFNSPDFLQGMSQLSDEALALGGSGWAELPPQKDWDPTNELTLSVWVKLDNLNGMPVLICKGAWRQAGYFLQIYREQVRFYLAGVDTLDAGEPQPGVWQHLVATYGHGEMSIYINGELVGHKQVSGTPAPSITPLLIGRYGLNAEVYFVQGLMDDVKIFDVDLTPQEIRAMYRQGAPVQTEVAPSP
jgi:hypothetical protein